MNLPNLASRPFLNTRPVWIVTGVALFVTLVLGVVNLRLYRASNQTLAEQLERREALVAQQNGILAEVGDHVEALQKVPWRTLNNRVERFNVILREHGFSWVEMLDDIEGVMPYQVRLTRISPSISKEEVGLGLYGVARTREAMFEFIDNLVADPRFANPKPSLEVHPEESNVVGYGFTLEVEYLPGALKEEAP